MCKGEKESECGRMISDKKVRVVITLPTEMNDKIEKLADSLGMTKSGFIGMSVGEKVMSYEKAFAIMNRVASEAVNDSGKKPDSGVDGQLDIIDVVNHLNAV